MARLPAGTGPEWYVSWVAGWMRSQRRRGRAETSLRTWAVYLRNLGAFLEVNRVDAAELLTREHLHRWQDQLQDHLMPASQQVAVSSARSLLKWVDREELSARAGLWAWLDTPHVPESDPRPLEPHALTAILTHYTTPRSNLEWMRDRALFWFLVTSDARISEALQVDVDQVQGQMIVRKKGGDEHRIFISGRSRQWVTEYLRIRGPDSTAALWIHIGTRGRRRLRADQANAIWAQLAQDLRLPRFTSHVLKHTGVTELGDRVESDEEVRQHVGWKSATVMGRYRKLRDRRHQELVDRLDELVPEPPPAPPTRRGRRFRIV